MLGFELGEVGDVELWYTRRGVPYDDDDDDDPATGGVLPRVVPLPIEEGPEVT